MPGAPPPPRVDAVSHVLLPAGPAARPPRTPGSGPVGVSLTLAAAALGALASGRGWMRMADMRGRGGMMGGALTDAAANGPRVVGVLLGISAALAASVWAGRRWPRAAYLATLALTGAYLALHGPLLAALPAPAVVLASLLRARPQREWLGWGALLVPAFLAAGLGEPGGLTDPALLWLVTMGVAWVITPALLLQLLGVRRATVAARHEEELRQVAYEERLRVARDIHDVVGHSLSMISLQSGVALHVLDRDPAQARASLEAIRDASRSSLAELRQTLGVFRRPDEAGPLVPIPSLDAVPALVESVRAGGQVVGYAAAPDAGAGVPESVQAIAYRVVQEALTNVVRHAHGAPAVVSVERRDGALTVSIGDAGPRVGRIVEGSGLRGMRERVESVGGRLEVVPRPAGGVQVTATLPLREAA